MALDASKVLGAEQIVGAIVSPRNTGKKAGGPGTGRVALLALTENDLALVKVRRVLTGYRVTDEVVARVPLPFIASAELGKSILGAPPLTITLTDGTTWNLDVAKVDTKRARVLLEMLDELQAENA
jgi:hypothetical protein